MDKQIKNHYQITVSDMAPHVHNFLPQENKVQKIFNWLTSWISLSLECGKIHPYDFLPTKADLACHIGVSQGTMQTVYRMLEDAGFVESKQRVGTYILGSKERAVSEKLTSKRELAIEIVKKFLLDNNYQQGDVLISARQIAKYTGMSNATIRLAMVHLVSSGILEQRGRDFIVLGKKINIEKVELKTLSEKVADGIRDYVRENLKAGDKLPTNIELTKVFNVSIKTIHDSIKLLTKEGLLYTRRGQYGTIVLGDSDLNKEYFYEKYENKIRAYIAENFQVGDKLPSIKELAKIYDTSEKTIRKALDNLAEEGYLSFYRGRYGGTFVMDIPQATAEAYKWLAISEDYMSN